ncbi:helix-turn-helix transcriptional regulator [Undibacterium jejuense]|uniref:Helix-turn-helix transcriptional regulator n=1 Tax=Undibacterium jejuense TaxID=1344949 RepID=A0A923HEX1_9BURK|nr:helix-turn-helix transcriptional regulator [Undibacterium jejuense]MBC3862771.1 helix-turn-helix transcriptional regulator [Undibacterium jejuense]
MPIIVNLDVVLAQRKMRLNTLSAIVGITVQNLSVLKTGKAKAIRFDTLEKICAILNCQPGDILAYTPDTNGVTQTDNHDLDSATISEADDQIDS